MLSLRAVLKAHLMHDPFGHIIHLSFPFRAVFKGPRNARSLWAHRPPQFPSSLHFGNNQGLPYLHIRFLRFVEPIEFHSPFLAFIAVVSLAYSFFPYYL